MNTKHTPGLWTVDDRGTWKYTPKQEAYINAGGFRIATVETPFAKMDMGEIKRVDGDYLSNARLISAAPDLLSIAKELAEWEQDPERYAGDLADLACRARAAIAKAKGKQ